LLFTLLEHEVCLINAEGVYERIYMYTTTIHTDELTLDTVLFGDEH